MDDCDDDNDLAPKIPSLLCDLQRIINLFRM